MDSVEALEPDSRVVLDSVAEGLDSEVPAEEEPDVPGEPDSDEEEPDVPEELDSEEEEEPDVPADELASGVLAEEVAVDS